MSSVEAGSVLGWLNPETQEWENAVLGNSGNEIPWAVGWAGSYASYVQDNGTDLKVNAGAYGVDVVGGTVWAILDNNNSVFNSEFAILAVPEPSTAWLILGGGLVSILTGRFRGVKD